jgi:hypothetical protein
MMINYLTNLYLKTYIHRISFKLSGDVFTPDFEQDKICILSFFLQTFF